MLGRQNNKTKLEETRKSWVLMLHGEEEITNKYNFVNNVDIKIL
jgi:hypothetical protein